MIVIHDWQKADVPFPFFNERRVAVLCSGDLQLRSLRSFYVERTVPGSAVGSIFSGYHVVSASEP